MTRDQLADLLAESIRDALLPVVDRLKTLEGRSAEGAAERLAIRSDLATLARDAGAVVERLAIVETKNGQPGPAGQDGRDGFGLKDFGVALQGDGRTLVFAFADGVNDKTIQVKTPWPVDRGPWRDGQTYDVGDVVSYDGSAWTAREATGARPGDQVAAWRLMVKRGRDASRGSRP